MTEKRFTSDKWQVYKDNTVLTVDETVKLLNSLTEENEELKKQLRDEQLKTIPITLTTHIADDDFERFEKLIKKHFGDDGND